MFTFFKYLTPEKAKELDDNTERGRREPLKYYQELASNNSMCEVCGANPVWKFGDTGMCFACTTGEADASDDYELI